MPRLALAFLLPLLAACSTTYQLAVPPEPGAVGLTVVQREGARRGAWVDTESASLAARRLSVEGSDVRLTLPADAARTLPLAEVRQIVFRQAGRGGLEGMGIGFMIGGVVGAALGASDPGWWDRGEAALLVGTVFGVLGAGAGGLVGLVVGHRVRIVVGSGS